MTSNSSSRPPTGLLYSSQNVKAAQVARWLCQKHIMISSAGSFFTYKNGHYQRTPDQEIKKLILFEIGDWLSKYKLNEIYFIKRKNIKNLVIIIITLEKNNILLRRI